MKGLRIIVFDRNGKITSVLEFSDVTDAQGIINTLRRKPATTLISQAVLAGEIVKVEARLK